MLLYKISFLLGGYIVNTKVKKGLKIAGNVILWLFVIFAAVITIMVFAAQKNANGLPSLFGKTLVIVKADSMSPTFKKGDMIVDLELTADQKKNLVVGDIITFNADLNNDGEKNEINTHKIVEVVTQGGYTYYRTQGENKITNPNADADLVRSDLVLGKYNGTRLIGIGKVFDFLKTRTGFLICIVLPLALFFLFEIYSFVSVIVEMKMKKKNPAIDEDEIKKKAIEEYLQQQSANQPDTVNESTEQNQ